MPTFCQAENQKKCLKPVQAGVLTWNLFEKTVYITVVHTNHNLGPLPSLHRDAAWSDEQKAGSN